MWKLYKEGVKRTEPQKRFFFKLTEHRETKNETSTKWHSLRRELLTMGETPITMTLDATKDSKEDNQRGCKLFGYMAAQEGLTPKGKDRNPKQ